MFLASETNLFALGSNGPYSRHVCNGVYGTSHPENRDHEELRAEMSSAGSVQSTLLTRSTADQLLWVVAAAACWHTALLMLCSCYLLLQSCRDTIAPDTAPQLHDAVPVTLFALERTVSGTVTQYQAMSRSPGMRWCLRQRGAIAVVPVSLTQLTVASTSSQ
jgi:hypothetical protein